MSAIRSLFMLFLVGLILLAQTACAFYQRYQIPSARLQKIGQYKLSVYILDSAHPLTRGWYLSEPKFERNSVSGFISRMAEVETLEASMLRNNADARQSKNDVLIYVKPQFALSLPDTASLSIPDTQLDKIEVCEMNHEKTIGLPLMGCTGLLLLGYLIYNEG